MPTKQDPAPVIEEDLKRKTADLEATLAEAGVETANLRLLANALESSAGAVAISDKTGKIVYANRACMRLWGVDDLSEIKGRSAADFWSDYGKAVEAYRTTMAAGGWSGELSARRKDGTTFAALAFTNAVEDVPGHPAYLMATFFDISEQKMTEEALRRSEEKYRQIAENSFDGIFNVDLSGTITYVSRGVERISGFRTGEMLGHAFTEFLAEAELAKAAEGIGAAIQGKRSEGYEFHTLRKDGTYALVQVNASALYNREGVVTGIQVTGRDITERRRLEEQLLQSQKMESIGRLAGGVAHDFNNLLTGIKGFLSMALEEIEVAHPAHQMLREVEKGADSAAALTKQLLTFSRKQIIDPKVVVLDQLIVELKRMLERIIGEEVELETFINSGPLGQVKVDPSQIEQVIINLAINARDAMPKGGKLSLTTANVELSRECCANHPYIEAGQYVLLSVSDTGIGMSEEVKSRLFEPFFTTKEKGKGTGLGLATAYGIVRQHNGLIEVYSEPGKGASFKIYLPRVITRHDTQSKLETEVLSLKGSETILVVEDEESVLKVAEAILKRQGYKVLACSDGKEALRISGEYRGTIHLLFTDMVMPGMDGRTLASRLIAQYPKFKVLFTSGYTESSYIHMGVMEGVLNFIPKPYNTRSLALKVREVLDG